jgi:hypothetical protein
MPNPTEGMYGSFSLGGSVVAVLAGIDLEWEAPNQLWASMGETQISDTLLGIQKFSGRFRKAYVDNTYLTVFMAGTTLVGTIYPIGGTTPYISGTIRITSGSLSGMEHQTENPVIEEGSFIIYSVSHS